MHTKEYKFEFEVYESSDELQPADAALLGKARSDTADAYAPYSKFRVAAVARLSDGTEVAATNQENASYPVGICAERVLLSTISSIHKGLNIDTIAISYHNLNDDSNTGTTVKSDRPISPCGMCRQALKEHEERTGQAIRLILGGMEGKVYVIEKASSLLPLGFSPEDLLP